MKIKFWLIIVVTFIIMAFAWWLYSLIIFTKNEHKLRLSQIKTENILLEHKAQEYLSNMLCRQDSTTLEVYRHHKEKVTAYLQGLVNSNSFTQEYQILEKDNKQKLNIKFEVNNKLLESYNQEYKRQLRTYYSEGLVFSILVILSVLWIFKKYEALLNVNRTQNNFLLSVTHELKTPIAAIKLSGQTMQQRKLNEEQQKHVLSQVTQNADRLNDLIDNVLLATRIDSKSYQYNMEPINLKELVEEEVNLLFAPQIFSGKINIQLSDLTVLGDRLALQLVLSNILNNALKYAGNTAEIKIYNTLPNNLIIADNGPGINVNEKQNIFNKFYRIGNENTRTNKGTGLGLFIVKQILLHHQAKISISNNSPKGAIFTLTFNTH